VTAFNQERLVDVVGDAWEELDTDLEALICEHFAGHVAALDDALAREGAQVDVELEGHLADVLNKEVSWLALVVGNFAEVKVVSAEAE